MTSSASSAIPTNFSKQCAAKIIVGMSTSPNFPLTGLANDSWMSTSNPNFSSSDLPNFPLGVLRLILLAVLMLAMSPEAFAKGKAEGESPRRAFPTGLGLIISFTPYYSTLSDESLQNYALSVGLTYDIDRRIELRLTFYTGEEVVASDPSRLVSGKLLMGAGSIGAVYHFAYFGRFRLYGGGGIDLQTILNGAQKGYNGNGFQLSAGTEYLLDRNISLSGGLLFKRSYYRSFVNNGNWSSLQPRFNDSWIGLTLAVNVHFD